MIKPSCCGDDSLVPTPSGSVFLVIGLLLPQPPCCQAAVALTSVKDVLKLHDVRGCVSKGCSFLASMQMQKEGEIHKDANTAET